MFDPKTVTHHYLIALLWSEIDDDGTPIDSTYDVSDISERARTQALSDCEAMLDKSRDAIAELPDDYTAEQFGHDFLLTRNGHGAGFWDRGLGELGDKLTEHAQSFGVVHAYVDADTDNPTVEIERG